MLELLKNKVLHHFALLISVLFLSACVPTSENPILIKGQKSFDEALFGVWYGALEEDDDPLYWHIFRADDGDLVEGQYPLPGGMQMVMIAAPEKGEEGGWAVLYALSATIRGKSFLSIDYKQDNGEAVDEAMRGYHLFHYAINNTGNGAEEMRLFAVDEDKLTDLIEENVLEGTVDKQKYSSEVRLTASSEALADYLSQADVFDLFQEEHGTFKRQTPNAP